METVSDVLFLCMHTHTHTHTHTLALTHGGSHTAHQVLYDRKRVQGENAGKGPNYNVHYKNQICTST